MTTKAEEDERRRARIRGELAVYETNHDIVPGTAVYGSTGAHGGLSWEGASRMAHARRLAGLHLDARDLDAMRRHPSPSSGVTARAGWVDADVQ